MNQDLTGNQFPPPGFQAEGSVEVNLGGNNQGENSPIVIDSAPTQGSGNAVSSGGVFEALEGKEDAIATVQDNPTNFFLAGNKTWLNLSTAVEAIVNEMDLGGGTAPEEIPAEYITETELEAFVGDDITAPLNLTPTTAAVYEAFSHSIARSVFSGNVSLMSAPAGCTVTIGESNVTIEWVPVFKGDHYVVFWVGNGQKLGQPSSLKISVQPAETIVPVGDTVLVSSSVSAGMLVNIYNDGGTPKIRPALGTATDRIAHAFVMGNAASGQTLVPLFTGHTNPYFTGLIPGTMYFLSWTNPGQIVAVGPDANSGYVWQPVGVAISTTELLFDPKNHVLRSGS
jgi:hypothetical protein